jgi:integrase
MMGKKGHYGSGSIDPSGKNSWRLRYRVDGQRYTKVVEGTRTEATKELRRLLHSGDTGSHVAPDKITLGQWIDRWLALKEPNVKARTYERYEIFLKRHVAPAPLGSRRLQKITPTEIDDLYKDRLFVKSCGRILTQNEGESPVDSGFVRIRRRSEFACESGMLVAGKG